MTQPSSKKPAFRALFFCLLALIVLTGGFLYKWWVSHPILVVYVAPNIKSKINLNDFIRPFRDAGVQRIQFRDGTPSNPQLGQKLNEVHIAVALSQDRNPGLDEDMIERGLTGPGYTDGFICYVYEPDVKLFIAKHRKSLETAGIADWDEVERRLITNTAAHEGWHAITQSTSHNPSDTSSLMYMDPGKSPSTYCWDKPLFTAGHKKRLMTRFAPKFP